MAACEEQPPKEILAGGRVEWGRASGNHQSMRKGVSQGD